MRRFAVPPLLAALALPLVGCPDEAGPSPDGGSDAASGCSFSFVGDPSQEMRIVPLVLGGDLQSTELADGGDVPLICPPQGGRVAFLGAKATNLDPCAARFSGAIRDPVTKQVRPDVRTVNLVPEADGWAATPDVDYASFANIAVCPNQWASTDVFDAQFEFQIDITDRQHRTGTAILRAVPRCTGIGIGQCVGDDLDAVCRCTCKEGYVPGSPCDASSSTAGSGS